YTIDKLSGDIAALMQDLGAERAHIVGHDWGGAVAWHMGAHHSEKVDRLVVVNSPHPAAFARELKKPGQLFRSWYALFFQLPLLPEAAIRLTLRRNLRSTAVQ